MATTMVQRAFVLCLFYQLCLLWFNRKLKYVNKTYNTRSRNTVKTLSPELLIQVHNRKLLKRSALTNTDKLNKRFVAKNDGSRRKIPPAEFVWFFHFLFHR